jgi:D-alanyl-D-alanine carboxypeptidase
LKSRTHCVRTLLVGLAVLVSVGPAAAQALVHDDLVAKIDALAAAALAQPGAAGISVGVALGDTIILDKGYGQADLENALPATGASAFRIASVTKQFTAAAVLRLAEQHKLALDDDITKYVDYPTQGRAVTIRHLLTHTSGLKSYTDVPGFFDHTSNDLSPQQVLDPVRGLPFDFEPGTKWAYCNTGYHLLGLIIERVSGVPYAKYMQDEFFTPLELTHTRYDETHDIIPGRARGYAVMNGVPANAPYLSMTIPYSAGGLLSSAGDLVRWQLALNAGKVLFADSRTQMTTPGTLADGSRTRYGMGLFMDDVDGHPNLMHEGGIPGFNSILVYFTNEKLSIAVLSNSPAVSAGRLAAEIAREAWGSGAAKGQREH